MRGQAAIGQDLTVLPFKWDFLKLRVFHIINDLLLGPTTEAERGTPGEKDRFRFGFWLLKKSEKSVILYTDLPEYFTAVPAGHGKLQRIMVGILCRVCSQLDEEPLAFEAEFSDLGPVEGIYFCVTLENQHSGVCY